MISFYPHQTKALELTEEKNRVAYYLDMGLGKTFVGAEKLHQLGKKVNLVVCQKSKVEDWVNHFRENYKYQYDVWDLTKKAEFQGFMNTVEELDFVPTIGVINYDLVFRRSYFAELTGFTLMLDESSIIQNETAKRSKFILKMKPDNVILLSGTPTAGKYERLWSQLHLLGWNISKQLFYKQYVITDWIEDTESGFKIPIVTGYKNVDRLKAKLAEYGAVFMKSEEAFELPEQIEIPVMCSITKDYRCFMKNDLVTVNQLEMTASGLKAGTELELIGDTTLTKRLYARQLCGQYCKEKLQAFEDLLFSTNERLIVFYNFNAELHLLQQIALKKTENISIVNGSVKDLSAYEQFDDSVTFIQYQAGAMGLNLQKANHIVYFTLTDKSELFEQSKKRIHRIGQEKPCFYYFLLCRNSVEMNILENLRMRKDYTDDLFKHYEEAESG